MTNRIAQQFAQDTHLSFRQKCRHILLMIFGHEGLIDTNDLPDKIAHCDVFDEDIHRLKTLKKQHLAKRKLFNPFKWIELLIVFPLEIASWTLQHHAEFFILVAIAYAVNFLVHSILAVPKRLLAPSQYIIRPSIELAKTNAALFAVTLCMAAAVIGFVAASVFLAGVPLLAACIATTVMIITAWPLCLGITTGLRDTGNAIINGINAPGYKKPEAVIPNSSTAKLTHALHGVNPKLSNVKKPEEQTIGETIALATGTEAIFYPAANPSAPSHRKTT